MMYKLLRFTPTRSLTYNNRWHQPVRPKHTLFFIPNDVEQFFLWLDFLCTTKRRNFLYIHTVVLKAVRSRTRVLKMWKGKPLLEVMIRERDYEYRRWFRTQRVLHTLKRVPAVLRRFQ